MLCERTRGPACQNGLQRFRDAVQVIGYIRYWEDADLTVAHSVARRMNEVPFSGIRLVFEEVARLEAAGEEIVHFEIGRPDFDTPWHIKEAAKKALDEGLVHYTSNYGLVDLRQAICEKLASENNVQADPENEIIVTAGANEAVFLAFAAFLDQGDEVLIPDPAWPHYFHCARLVGAVPVSVPLRLDNGFQLDLHDLLNG